MGTAHDPANTSVSTLSMQDGLLSSPYTYGAERYLKPMSVYLLEHAQDDPEELEGVLRAGIGLDSIPEWTPQTPAEHAQVLAWQAFDAPQSADRMRLARQALRLSPDCVDALYLLGNELAQSAAEALSYYDRGIAIATRLLGDAFIEDNAGEFWSILETRPMMRCMAGRVQALASLERHADAAATGLRMLELNPEDNQGTRFTVALELMRSGNDTSLEKLIYDYPEDETAPWMYLQALAKFRLHGPTSFAGANLFEAIKLNAFVPAYFMGKREILRSSLGATFTPGDQREARLIAVEQATVWQEIPGALAWLAGALQVLNGKTPEHLEWYSHPLGSGPVFFLNHDDDLMRYTKCPQCDGRTRPRVFNITTLVDPGHLVPVRQSTPYCPDCDLMIVHATAFRETLEIELEEQRPDLCGRAYIALGIVKNHILQRRRPDGELGRTWLKLHTQYFSAKRQFTVDRSSFGWVQETPPPKTVASPPPPLPGGDGPVKFIRPETIAVPRIRLT